MKSVSAFSAAASLLLHAILFGTAVHSLPGTLDKTQSLSPIRIALLPPPAPPLPLPQPAAHVTPHPATHSKPPPKPTKPAQIPKRPPEKPRRIQPEVTTPVRPSAPPPKVMRTEPQAARPSPAVATPPSAVTATPERSAANVPSPMPPPPAKTSASAATYALSNAKPPYPRLSRLNDEQGTVVLRVLVRADGSAGTVEVKVSSGYPLLDDSARRTVQTWRFNPATIDGKAVAEWYQVAIPFTLQEN